MVLNSDLHGQRLSGPGRSDTSPGAIPSDGAQAFLSGEQHNDFDNSVYKSMLGSHF